MSLSYSSLSLEGEIKNPVQEERDAHNQYADASLLVSWTLLNIDHVLIVLAEIHISPFLYKY